MFSSPLTQSLSFLLKSRSERFELFVMFPLQAAHRLLPYFDVILEAESDGVLESSGQTTHHSHNLPMSEYHSGQVGPDVSTGA